MAKERVAELQMDPNRIVTSKLPGQNGLIMKGDLGRSIAP